MASAYYKKFLRLAQQWPKDPLALRPPERDAATFVKKEIERIFRKEQNIFNESLCQERLRSLEQIIRNEHVENFPITYKFGAMAVPISELRKMNSPEGRYVVGLERKLPSLGKSSSTGFIAKALYGLNFMMYKRGLKAECPTQFAGLEGASKPLKAIESGSMQ